MKKELTKKNKKQESIKEIKKIADVWEHIDKKDKNTILKSIIKKNNCSRQWKYRNCTKEFLANIHNAIRWN